MYIRKKLVNACNRSKYRLAVNAASIVLKLSGLIKPRRNHISIIQPNKIPKMNPKILKDNFLKDFILAKYELKYPIIPHATICQGVQGPCPKIILDTIAVIEPTIKPVLAPKT